MKTLLRSEPGIECCYVCGTTHNLHEHHVYGGPNRSISEAHGCKVKLCGPHHNLTDAGVHFNPRLDKELKQLFQRLMIAEYGAMDYMRLIGRSYLEGDDD